MSVLVGCSTIVFSDFGRADEYNNNMKGCCGLWVWGGTKTFLFSRRDFAGPALSLCKLGSAAREPFTRGFDTY